jgi:hypothetical protein
VKYFPSLSAVVIAAACATYAQAGIIIADIAGLQSITNDLSADYILANNIDASITGTWNSGAGFIPIGNSSAPFTGSFDGQGHTITGLTMKNNLQLSGLFGEIGSTGRVSNIALVNAHVTNQSLDASQTYVGALAAQNKGTVSNASVSGGNTFGTNPHSLGQLVGYNTGTITESHSSGTLTTHNNTVGGLVGYNNGQISLSYSTTNLAPGAVGGIFGGLVGLNDVSGSISQSYATGNVVGYANTGVGGLAALSRGSIESSYATGNVSMNAEGGVAGGLVGYLEGFWDVPGSGHVSQSYSTGRVTGGPLTRTGGLIGFNWNAWEPGISSYWDIQTSGQSTSEGGTPLTTAQLQSSTLPAGFDPSVWSAKAGEYPKLTGVGGQQTPTLAPSITLTQYVRFAEAAYGGPLLVAGYNEIPLSTLSGTPQPEGFSARVFSDTDSSTVVLTITGTDKLYEWLNPNPSFISPFGPTQVLKDYVTAAATILDAIKATYPDAKIALTGHSLGGAIAQILANATGIGATTFNAPGVGGVVSYFTDLPQQLSHFSAPSGQLPITNYRIYGDLVSTIGTPLGTATTITYEPPIPKIQIDLFPLGTAKPMHGLFYMLERVENNAKTTDSIGPTAAEVLVDTGGLIIPTFKAKLAKGIELGVSAVVVLGAWKYGLDPEGGNEYWFQEEAGSPRVASIIFPLLENPNAVFRLETFSDSGWASLGLFGELSSYDFGPLGVDQFRFFILDEFSLLPLQSVGAFTLGMTFVEDGILNATLTEIFVAVPEPSSVHLLASALGFVVLLLGFRRRRISEA